MSKTIDVEQEVRAGDTWTIRESGGPVYQYREGKCMCVWSFVRRHNHCGPRRLSDEIDVSKDFAFGVLRSWGYTLTQPEPKGEKAETDLAATVKRVEERLEKVETNANYVNGEYSALDTDLKALAETVNAVREATNKNAIYRNELERRVAKLEAVIAEAQSLLNESPKAATTPAKVRVVAPTTPDTAPMTNERFHGWSEGWCQSDERWRAALSAAGVEVKEAGQ